MIKALVMVSLLVAAPVLAAVPVGFVDRLVASGLDQPISLDFLPDGRCILVERAGAVKVIEPTGPRLLFTVPGVNTQDENGLLGIAVDPAWPVDIYLFFTTDARLKVSRFSPGGTEEQVILDLPNIQRTHNGGTLRYGLDRRLYASLGDDHQTCAVPDTASMFGKIVRLGTCYTDPAAPEIFAFGLRNPFRFQVDLVTGRFLIGDVGEIDWEELNLASGGEDFGWPYREGPNPVTFVSGCAIPPGVKWTDPIWSDPHGCCATRAIISAGIYRRNHGQAQWPLEYDGNAFASDFYSGVLTRVRQSGSSWTASVWGTGFSNVADWLEGPDGAMWRVDLVRGELREITYAGTVSVPEGPRVMVRPGLWDPSGRRISNPATGVYFDFRGRKVVVIR